MKETMNDEKEQEGKKKQQKLNIAHIIKLGKGYERRKQQNRKKGQKQRVKPGHECVHTQMAC